MFAEGSLVERLAERPKAEPKAASSLTQARRFGASSREAGPAAPARGPAGPLPRQKGFSQIPLDPPSPGAREQRAYSGSTATNAEEEGLFIGAPPSESDTATSSETETSGSEPSVAPSEREESDPRAYKGPTAVAPTITSKTAKAAPSGAKADRSKVGVGESVTFTGSAPGTWSASSGAAKGASPTKKGAKKAASSATFAWTAPAVTTATSATITLKVSGLPDANKKLTVVPPNKISMKNSGSHSAQVGAGGACMLTEVTFAPLAVNLGAMRWLEEPGPATSVSGYFSRFTAATLAHKPNTHFALVNDKNVMEAGPKNAPNDHIAAHTLPSPYKTGAFEWVIENQYILDGEAKSKGRRFAKTTQRYEMDGAGNLTITKAGATT